MSCTVLSVQAQDEREMPDAEIGSEPADTDYVYLLNADLIRFESYINPDAQRLMGNVVFRHDSMYMYCDSALFFKEANSFNAYHNVRVEQGDTLFLYGDSMFYDGNTRLLRVRDNVRLENKTMILLTDSLNYDRNTGLGWFFDGGTLLDEESTLISEYGQFDTNTNLATFIDGVSMESPDYTLKSDTLLYDTDLHTAYITSPTEIVNDDNFITTSRGQFNTDSNNAILLDRSVVINNEGDNRMTGDSIVYDKASGIMKGYGDVIVNNYKDKVDVNGEYAFYNQNNDSAVVTGKALLTEYSMGDTLFVHADTFRLVTFYNEAGDSVIERQMRGFNKVRAYRFDMQMVADSMVFTSVDSSLTLYHDPIVWNEDQQVLGEKIIFYMNDSTIDWAHVIGQALFIQRNDSVHYNQITGREMKAYFKNGDIDKADVIGNVLAVFYPLDADSAMIGMNTTEASNLTIYFKMRAVDRIVVRSRSNGIMFPMDKIDEKKMFLANFNWFDRIRPRDPEDVFYWRGKRVEEQLSKNSSIKEVPLPTLDRKKRK
jgi:lipopolysaccharide export system protein LptA